MKTRPYYWENTYLFDATARVVALKEDDAGRNYLILDQTIFYPQGGGQPSDRGEVSWAGGLLEVILVKIVDGEVRHYVEGSVDSLSPGQEVSLAVDGDTRLHHARLHTAGHVLATVVVKAFNSLRAVKGHHFPGECYVEFEGALEGDRDMIIDTLNEGLAHEIEQNWPITARVDGSTGMRDVQIGEYPPVHCGGTHVNATGELNLVTVRKFKAKKGSVKIAYE